MDLPIKMPITKQVQQLIKQGDYVFSIYLKDACLHISIIQHQCHFFVICFAK